MPRKGERWGGICLALRVARKGGGASHSLFLFFSSTGIMVSMYYILEEEKEFKESESTA